MSESENRPPRRRPQLQRQRISFNIPTRVRDVLRKRKHHSTRMLFQSVTICVSLTALILAAVAFVYDYQWNDYIRDLNDNDELIEQTVGDLHRDLIHQIIFMSIITCITITSVAYNIILFKGYRRTFRLTTFIFIMNLVAAFTLLALSWKYIMTSFEFNVTYQFVARGDIHEHLTDYILCDVRNYQALSDEQKDLIDETKLCQRIGVKYVATCFTMANFFGYALNAWLEWILYKKWAKRNKRRVSILRRAPDHFDPLSRSVDGLASEMFYKINNQYDPRHDKSTANTSSNNDTSSDGSTANNDDNDSNSADEVPAVIVMSEAETHSAPDNEAQQFIPIQF